MNEVAHRPLVLNFLLHFNFGNNISEKTCINTMKLSNENSVSRYRVGETVLYGVLSYKRFFGFDFLIEENPTHVFENSPIFLK